MVWMPNDFIHGIYDISCAGHIVFATTVGAYQSGYDAVGEDCFLFWNEPFADGMMDELQNFIIRTSTGDMVKIYDHIERNNGVITYEFTKEALKYINHEGDKTG